VGVEQGIVQLVVILLEIVLQEVQAEELKEVQVILEVQEIHLLSVLHKVIMVVTLQDHLI
jgi:hypothetical protein